MKKYNHYLLLAASVFVISCGHSTSGGTTDKEKDEAQKGALADTVKTTDVLQVGTGDAGFAYKAAASGMMEIQLSGLAQRNALNQQVKNYGAMMVKDHTKSSTELKNLANSKKLTLPVALEKDVQDRVDSMSLQSSAGFDLKYMEMMVQAHQKDVAEFEKATTTVKDPDLKAFAVKNLPILKMHLNEAEKLNASLNKKNDANNAKNASAQKK